MDNAFEQDLKLDMLKYDGSHPRHLVAIQRAASHYHKLANQAMLKDKEEQTMHKKDQQAQDTYFSRAYRILSDKATAPITFLRRIQVGPKGDAPGTFATNHSELDAILQQAWGGIYHGVAKPLQDVTREYMHKYSNLFFKAEEIPLDDIDPVRFMEHCLHAKNSASGMDGWEPKDFKLLPLSAFAHLTNLLNAVEKGAEWPTGLLSGRLVFFAKDSIK